MRLFKLVKETLLEIQASKRLVDFKRLRKENKLLIFEHIISRGREQDKLRKVLRPLFKQKQVSEIFFAYIVWIAGEAVNNVFDHGQTLGQIFSGGLFALDIRDNKMELAIGDLGVGIMSSLRKHPELQERVSNSRRALELALLENVSGWPYRRGNGLPDILRIVEAGEGVFSIYSDGWVLKIRGKKKTWEQDKKHIPGVILSVKLPVHDFEVPRRERPKGKVIKLSKFGRQLSGRDKGQEAYESLVRAMTKLPRDGVLLINLAGVMMMNSSFGDQSLGVLLEAVKAGHFGAKKIFFIGDTNKVVRFCLDRVAELRQVEIEIV